MVAAALRPGTELWGHKDVIVMHSAHAQEREITLLSRVDTRGCALPPMQMWELLISVAEGTEGDRSNVTV